MASKGTRTVKTAAAYQVLEQNDLTGGLDLRRTPTEPVQPERPNGQAETEALIDVARRIRAAMTNQMV